MMLSDETIRMHVQTGSLRIEPFDEQAIQPASIDLRLGSGAFYSRPVDGGGHIDVSRAEDVEASFHHSPLTQTIDLLPGDFVIATTAERITLPDNLVGIVNGKSSLGRLGLLIHATAGFVDPGFSGQITLELSNVSRNPLLLRAGMRICQMSFQYLDVPANKPYGHPDLNSKYAGQEGATLSKYHLNKV